MSADVLGHVAYAICNARVQLFPFPHIYVRNVFPDDFYAHLLTKLPQTDQYGIGKSNYKGRKFADPTPIDELKFMQSAYAEAIFSTPFHRFINARFQGTHPATFHDLRLVRDQLNYSIGPHTDAPWKVLSYLFYLPPDDSLAAYGTSIYLPNDSTFRCPGGPHHNFSAFTRIYTAPFLPNSLFAFFKTDNSFHGVEPITIPCQRDVLLWNLYDAVARPNP